MASFGPMYISGKASLGSVSSQTFQTNQASIDSISSVSLLTTSSFIVGGNINASTLAAANISGSNLKVSSLVTNSLSASRLTANGLITLSTTTSTIGANGLTLGSSYISAGQMSAINTPWVSTSRISSSQIYTSSIEFSDISGSIPYIQLGNVTIQNPFGSLTIGDITASSSRIPSVRATIMSTPTLKTTAISASDPALISSIGANDRLRATSIRLADCSVSTAISQSLTAGSLVTQTISPSTFIVNTSITLEGPAFYFPDASFNDVSGSAVAINTTVISTLVKNVYASTIDAPVFTAKALNTAAIDVSNVNAYTMATSTMRIDRQTTVGKPFNYSTLTPGGPWMSTFAFVDIPNGFPPLTSPPYQTASGFGVYNNPFTTVNVYFTRINFSFNSDPVKPLYFNIEYRHTNTISLNGGLTIILNGHVILSIINIYLEPIREGVLTNINLSSYPIIAPNPITGDMTTPWCTWEAIAGGTTTDSMTMWISNNTYATDLASTSIMDPTVGIEMNVASMKWPSTVYTTTIINQFNDIQTRSLLYTGGLQSISDRALKTDIVDADLERCAGIVKETPLRRYQYVPEYVSTFKTADRTRLGILTTELATAFPKSVRVEETPMGPAQTASLGQLKYAHLGATKFLMEEIAALKVDLSNLHSLVEGDE